MEDDAFEWSDWKEARNKREHKIGFRLATRAFDDPMVLILPDDSEDYDEDRFVAIGLIEERIVTVVFTERGDRIRIISAWKSSNHERRTYHQGS